jgi:hypothetical protein
VYADRRPSLFQQDPDVSIITQRSELVDETDPGEELWILGETLFDSGHLKEFEGQYAHAPQAKMALDDHVRHFIMYDDPQWYFVQMDIFLKSAANAKL